MNTFSYTQSTPSDTWTIEHGLNTYPTLDVHVQHEGQLHVALPKSIEYIDANTVVVSFTDPQTGAVRLAGGSAFRFSTAPMDGYLDIPVPPEE